MKKTSKDKSISVGTRVNAVLWRKMQAIAKKKEITIRVAVNQALVAWAVKQK